MGTVTSQFSRNHQLKKFKVGVPGLAFPREGCKRENRERMTLEARGCKEYLFNESQTKELRILLGGDWKRVKKKRARSWIWLEHPTETKTSVGNRSYMSRPAGVEVSNG